MTDSLIGTKVRLEYYDQNESFKKYLPLIGTIRQHCVSKTEVDGWYLIDLDKSFDYQHECGPTFQFQRFGIPQVLIRSRWAGEPISRSTSPSVFLLLVFENHGFSIEELELDDFIHVCWARCHVLD